jgi:hypothetical protein
LCAALNVHGARHRAVPGRSLPIKRSGRRAMAQASLRVSVDPGLADEWPRSQSPRRCAGRAPRRPDVTSLAGGLRDNVHAGHVIAWGSLQAAFRRRHDLFSGAPFDEHPLAALRRAPLSPTVRPQHVRIVAMRLPVTERVAASTLAFPFLSQFTDDEVSQVADALVEVADVEAQG